MKKLLQSIFFIAVVMMSLTLNAQKFAQNGITFNRTSENTCEVIRDWQSPYIGAVEIPNSVTYNSSELTVTVIGDYAFQSCTELTSVTIPNSIVSIKKSAFEYCQKLQSIDIPNGVVSIDESAFAFDNSLTSVFIPKTVQYIGKAAFTECKGISSFSVDSDNNTYMTIDGVLCRKDNALLCAYPISKAADVYEIPNVINTIADFAFSTVRMKAIVIPSSVSAINPFAFNRFYVGDYLVSENSFFFTDINGVLFFKDKTRLVAYPISNSKKSYSIPNGTKWIGESAFYSSRLESITFPESLILIESMAFYNSIDLSEINCLSEMVPILEGEGFHSIVYDTATLYVPIGTLDDYRNSSNWGKFKDIQEKTGSIKDTEINDIKVYSQNGNIIINGDVDSLEVTVVNLSGQIIYSGFDKIIPINSNGVYFIKIANKSYKVIV